MTQPSSIEAGAIALYLEDENDYSGDADWPAWESDDNVARDAYRERAGAVLFAAQVTSPVEAAPFPRVSGFCPTCRRESLFLASGGHVTCSRLECREPESADNLLHVAALERPGVTASPSGDGSSSVPPVAKPNMVMRSIRVPLALWTAAKEKADERQENLSDVLREALERYVRRR